jgi:uncharacterized membrane protein
MTPAAFERPAPSLIPPRIAGIDVARGIAIVAMMVFHAAYDLSTFRLIATDVSGHAGWRLFAGAIGGSFLTLVGVSLVLATQQGINWPAFLRRLALVAGGAALVTLGTWLWMPDFFVFFGILHLIALGSVTALPFLALPPPLTLAASALCFAVSWLVALPVLDQRWLLWTGLSRLPVDTADYYPVLPWFGFVLLGVALARIAVSSGWTAHLAAFRADGQPWRLLTWMGRHSLPIYLIHQPVFIALLSTFVWLRPTAALPPMRADAETRPFVEACVRTCVSNGKAADDCQDACQCTADGLRRDGLWRQALSGQMSTTERTRVGEIARVCTQGE